MIEPKKRAVEIKIDEKELTPSISQSQAKADYAALIAAYAKHNPVKYEIKKAVLQARLAAM